MPLQSITVEVSGDTDAAFVSDVLFELGALSVSTSDLHRGTSSEEPIYAEPPQNSITPSEPSKPPTLWHHARVTALFPLSVDSEALLMTIATDFRLPQTPTLRIHSEPFDDKTPVEWVAHAQASFKPIVLGRIAISFPWHTPVPGVLNVVLEPGLPFGTGEHATTQLCARWLLNAVSPGTELLDFGTGSGVLAILAAMLEDTATAVGVDIDPDALPVAWRNAKRNCVENRVSFYENREEPEGSFYDVVVANVLAGPLKMLADRLVSRTRVGGRIALSGILISQAEEMKEWYGQRGVVMDNAAVDSEWVLLVGTKT